MSSAQRGAGELANATVLKVERHSNTPAGVLTPSDNLRKRASLIFLATDAPIADDISKALIWAADEIDRLTASAEQVRREARTAALEEAAARIEDHEPWWADKIRALITPQKEGEE